MSAQMDRLVLLPDVEHRLLEHFDQKFTDVRGGVEIDYVTGEQVTSRLIEALGWSGWSFTVKDHGIHTEADEVWVLGRLEAGGVVREQFGSQKIKRSRSTGAPLDIGFDLKGATTDALKKCATLIGVALYLSEKEGKPVCQECDTVLQPVRRGGETIPVSELMDRSRETFKRVLCVSCARKASTALAASAAEHSAEPVGVNNDAIGNRDRP